MAPDKISSRAGWRFGDSVELSKESKYMLQAPPGDAEYSEYMAAWLLASRDMDNHIEYMVEVNLGKTRWIVHRRYSEFRDLRQTMVKQMAKRTGCSMCKTTLQDIEAMEFPPKKPFYSTSIDLDKRQAMLQQFVLTLVGLVQMMRQHQLLMLTGSQRSKTSACDVTDLLHVVEDFFGLNFTRYTNFLAERGVLNQVDAVRLA
ncbi:hypothetical protein AeMF1_017727 [Aphanomyces euteiches]|nr:hypothetical protein AeMF1_017727 [Aphanomyces euteiches]